MIARKLILSVDDELGILRSRQAILEERGYEVLNASSREQALGIFSTMLIDLAVLDYSLPGVNGGQVAKVMKARRPELPIIMISGRPVEIETLLSVDGFLVKGESPALLLEKIEEVLDPTSATRLPAEVKMSGDGDGRPELWEELATLASAEQNSDKLITLVNEIDRLLGEKHRHSNDGPAQRAYTETNRVMEPKKPRPDDGPNTANSK